jgi:hypothetical protein
VAVDYGILKPLPDADEWAERKDKRALLTINLWQILLLALTTGSFISTFWVQAKSAQV